MSKKTVAVLFGGQSSEHEISCLSAANIIHNIDREAYDLVLVGITKEGHWVKVSRVEDIEDGSWRESKVGAVLSPDATERCLMIHEQAAITRVKIDLVFPARTAPFRAFANSRGFRSSVAASRRRRSAWTKASPSWLCIRSASSRRIFSW